MMKEDGLILSIAGHDPTGGAGIQTDAFIANSFGIHCLSILTCQTIQNLESFQMIIPSKRGFIQESFESTHTLRVATSIIVKSIFWKYALLAE